MYVASLNLLSPDVFSRVKLVKKRRQPRLDPTLLWEAYRLYLSACAVVIRYEEALYQVYAPLPFTFIAVPRLIVALRKEAR